MCVKKALQVTLDEKTPLQDLNKLASEEYVKNPFLLPEEFKSWSHED